MDNSKNETLSILNKKFKKSEINLYVGGLFSVIFIYIGGNGSEKNNFFLGIGLIVMLLVIEIYAEAKGELRGYRKGISDGKNEKYKT